MATSPREPTFTDDDDRPMSAATSAFPTFLETDPYPSRNRDGRPTSSSSIKTDGTSEFGGDESTSTKERNSNVLSSTGPVGEPGLPPSRPMSMDNSVSSSHRTGRSQAGPPSSRRGLAAFAVRGGGALRGSGSDNGLGYRGDMSSRPGTSVSKTHVPSLTAGQGFFRPMSSQKLQAQRNQRPSTALAKEVPREPGPAKRDVRDRRDNRDSIETDRGTQRTHRYSNASVHTVRDNAPPTRDEDIPPLPVSRGTAFTSDGAFTEGAQTAASVASNNSTVPLQNRDGVKALNLDAIGSRDGQTALQAPPKSSPVSLRASLGFGSRRTSSRQDNLDRRPTPSSAHEHLPSEPSSPTENMEKPPFSMSSHTPSRPQQSSTGRNYEFFAGNLLFFMGGRFLNAKARPLDAMTFVLTILPGALFLAFSAPWLWHHVSPAIPIIFAYFFYITVSALFHAAFSDPGILPRNLHPHPVNPEEERDPLTVGPPTTEWIMVKTFPTKRNSPAAQASAEESGNAQTPGQTTAMEVPTKYCKSCNIWRPPRAHHCRTCDACIETQDHHCVWLNICVGRRNYRFFFAYVGFGAVMCLLLLAFSLTHVGVYASQNNISFARALSGRTQERVAFAMFIYSILALPYPGSLFAYHLFLVARGETTREYLNSHKFLPKDRHRPFSQSSWWSNWVAVLIRPRPPTYMRFRKAYAPGDVRLGFTKSKKVRRQELKGRYSVGTEADGKREKDGAVEMKALSPQAGRLGNGVKVFGQEAGVRNGGAGADAERSTR